MTRLHTQHWMLAFMLAFMVHMAAFIFSINFPGSVPVFRGGSTVEQDRELSPGAGGVFVQLGKSAESSGDKPSQAKLKQQAPVQKPQQTLAQAFVDGAGEPGSAARDAEPSETPEPTGKRAEEPTVIPPAKEAGPAPETVKDVKIPEQKVAAAPVPRRKPDRPLTMPEMETLGRRLSVQGPVETAAPTAPAEPPETATPSKDVEKTVSNLSFVSGNSRAGTASGSSSGEVRELNYEDEVMLWLKRHGAYPYEATLYRLEDIVTVKFAISRQGKILYYELIKTSKWILLNEAVNRMMDRSSPVPPIPPEITKDKMTFTIPIHFAMHHPR